ncbi:hypothetical protein ES707_08326 [subsurface metagenome]
MYGQSKRGEAPLPLFPPFLTKERGIKGVRLIDCLFSPSPQTTPCPPLEEFGYQDGEKEGQE